jgi:hypothetical protein
MCRSWWWSLCEPSTTSSTRSSCRRPRQHSASCREPLPLVHALLLHHLESLTLTTLHKVFRAMELSWHGQTFDGLIATLLEYYEVPPGQADELLERARALMAKRARKKPQADEPDEAEGEQEEEIEVIDDTLPVSSTLKKVAPRELAYLLGKVPAGAGIGEEDDDEGVAAFIAKADKIELARRAKKARVETPMVVGGAAASSWEGLPAPHLPEPSVEAEALQAMDEEDAEAAPASIDPTRATRLQKLTREAPMQQETCPPGCTLRQYVSVAGVCFWEGKLPAGKEYLGQRSCSRCFHTKLRSEAQALQEVGDFLKASQASGALE